MPITTGYAKNQRSLKLDPEAAELLDTLAPSRGRRGRYVSNLILAEHARKEERARLRAALLQAGVLEPESPEELQDGA